MRHTRQNRRHQPQPAAVPAPVGPQPSAVIGVIQHPTTRQYQVWMHANGRTVMLLAYRWEAKAQAGATALRAALARGEGSTPERWRAAVKRIGVHADGELEPVPEAVFAAIEALVRRGAPGPDQVTACDQ